jgi:hypothetical protein
VAKFMLDERHAEFQYPHDDNAYTHGSICRYNVVIPCLPVGVYGIAATATVASQMMSSFRLGDIIISIPNPQCPVVVQYDYGKTLVASQFQRTRQLDKPPSSLLKVVSNLRASHGLEPSRILAIMREAFDKYPRLKPGYPYPD